jgi:osmotically-inducible protein OsmY
MNKALEEKIKKNIVDSLYLDERIDSSDINVEVDEDGVLLLGSTPNYFQKTTAGRIAWTIKGVDNVKNQIKVTQPKNTKEYSDKDIKANIQSTLRWTESIDTEDIIARVKGGSVTLTGTVDAAWKRRRLEEMIYDLGGVVEIVNKVNVVLTETRQDNVIADAVTAALERSAEVEPENISIRVQNGEVTLTGSVKNRAEFEAARDAALFTAGVKDLRNNLDIVNKETEHIYAE